MRCEAFQHISEVDRAPRRSTQTALTPPRTSLSWSVSGRRGLRVGTVLVWLVVAIGAAIVAIDLPAAVGFAATKAPAGFWALALAALVVDVPLFGLSGLGDVRPRSTLSICFTFAIFVLWGAAPAILVQAAAGIVT